MMIEKNGTSKAHRNVKPTAFRSRHTTLKYTSRMMTPCQDAHASCCESVERHVDGGGCPTHLLIISSSFYAHFGERVDFVCWCHKRPCLPEVLDAAALADSKETPSR